MLNNHSPMKTFLSLGIAILLPVTAYAANGANFVLYNHHMAEVGEKELMLMNDIGQLPDGTRYTAQMLEFELGITAQWTTEFMIEGQNTSGQGGYNFTGFRWENRYRVFDREVTLNPVLYLEYEDLSSDTLYLMEVSGREDATRRVKSRPRERVLETRLILSQNVGKRLNIAANWLNESDLDTGVTAFGYAVGINFRLDTPVLLPGREDEDGDAGVVLGLELFGGAGDADKGPTLDGAVTQHYLAPNLLLQGRHGWKLKFGGAIGLTNVSQDLFRMAVAYEF